MSTFWLGSFEFPEQYIIINDFSQTATHYATSIHFLGTSQAEQRYVLLAFAHNRIQSMLCVVFLWLFVASETNDIIYVWLSCSASLSWLLCIYMFEKRFHLWTVHKLITFIIWYIAHWFIACETAERSDKRIQVHRRLETICKFEQQNEPIDLHAFISIVDKHLCFVIVPWNMNAAKIWHTWYRYFNFVLAILVCVARKLAEDLSTRNSTAFTGLFDCSSWFHYRT